MRGSQDLGRLAKPKFQPVVKLCLCKSYSVLTACIASLLQNQAYPVITSYYSRHYSNSPFTIQIRGTIQKSGTIQIQNMNCARALTREWLRHPNFLLFKALTIWMKATCVGSGYECVIVMRVISRVKFHN